MAATRSRKEERTYKSHLKKIPNGLCEFCAIDQKSKQLIRASRSFKIIRNIFPYSLWDGQKVTEHIMVVPKKHIDNLSQMTEKEKIEFVDLIESYERQGYNIYTRAPVSVIKSVVHQHTHMIKTEGSPKKLVFLLRKPYIRILR